MKNYYDNKINILAAIELEETLNKLMRRYISIKPGNEGTVTINTTHLVEITKALEDYQSCYLSNYNSDTPRSKDTGVLEESRF